MDDINLLHGLSIKYQGSEWTPDHTTQYLGFTARMKSDSFAAEIEFEVTGQHLIWFVEQLNDFYQTLLPAPELAAG